MTKSQRGVKFARIEKLFPHEQPTPHQRDDVTELGNHRQVTENATFFLACLAAMELEGVVLEEI